MLALHRTFGAVLALIVLSGCSRNADYYFEKGTRAAAAGNDPGAILNFRKALQKNPRSGETYLRLGLAYQRQSKFAEAYQTLQQAAVRLPDSEEAKTSLADLCLEIYVADRNHPKAVYDQLNTLINQLLVADARSFNGLRLRANLEMLDKHLDQAIESFRQAARIRPMQPNVTLPLVQCLFETNQPAEAEQLALQLIARDKTAEAAYDLLYVSYTRENRAADARAILQRKVENNPNTAGPRLQLALHYARLGKHPEMSQALQPLLDNPQKFPQARLQVGDFYAALGNPEEALSQYREGFKNSTEKLVCQKRVIDTWMRQGKREEAAKMAEAALHDNPADDELKTAKATLLIAAGKPQDVAAATAIFRELVKAQPDVPTRRLNLARSAMLQGDLETARTELLETLRHMPSSVPVRVLLANVSLQKRDFNEALRFTGEILKIQPENAGARLVRSASLMALGRYKEVRPELDQVLAAHPKSVDAQVQLGSLNLVEGRAKDAEFVFRKAWQAAQSDVRPLEGLLTAQIEQHQLDNALRLINQEVAKAPESVALRGLLAETALRAGNTDFAIEQYKQLLTRNPGRVELYLRIGEALRSKGAPAEALAQFEKARQLAPKDARPQLSLADTQNLMGQKEAARNSYRQALAIQPDNPFTMNNLAYLVAETGGDPQEAQKLVQAALKKQPQQPDFIDTLGSIYQKTGQTDSAVQVFDNLVRQYPHSAEFRYHLAMSLAQKGNRAKAREALTAAIAQKPTGRLDSDIRGLLAQLN